MKLSTVFKGLPYMQYLYGLMFYAIVELLVLIARFARIIAWPWVWVLAPLWIPLGLSAAGIIAAITVHVIGENIRKMNSLKKTLAAKTEEPAAPHRTWSSLNLRK